MSEDLQRRLVMIFCLRCSETLATLSDEDLAFQLRISMDRLAETKAVFVRKGFIGDDWAPKNWDKRQRRSDSSAERTRDYRERKRDAAVTSHVTASDALDTDTDTDTDEKNQKKDRKPAMSLPQWLPPDVWADWNQYRSTRKGWTAKARELSLKTLGQLHADGCCPRAVIDQSIERGWSGLFTTDRRQNPSVGPMARASKTMSAIMALEEMKSGLEHPRNFDRLPEASLPRLGGSAGGRGDPGDGRGLV